MAMVENIEFEEKPDIANLILPSKPIKLEKIESYHIKQEPLEEETHHADFESDLEVGREIKLKMEGDILKLFKELDKEKSENSPLDFSLRKSLKIRQIVENYTQLDPGLIRCPISRDNKTKIVKITEEHKTAMSIKVS